MSEYIVTVKFKGGKESKYIAPSIADSPERAVFEVALTWHFDFLVKVGESRPNTKIESLSVVEKIHSPDEN